MNISTVPNPFSFLRAAFLCAAALLLCLAPVSASSESKTFAEGNKALAHGDAGGAVDAYLKIVKESGTSPALADNLAHAADLASQPGLAEWARRTALLRRTEWWLVLAGFSAAAWAAAIALGAWRRWSFGRFAAASLLGAAGIAAGLYCARRWMPPADEAVVIHAAQKSVGAIPAAEVFLSPFDSSEVVGTLQPGAHVRILPTEKSSAPAPKDYLRISQPDTSLTGWIRADEVRRVGK